MEQDNILGVNGIPAEGASVGIGFVTIPPEVDIFQFKEDCFASNTISIAGMDFGHYHQVPVDEDVMQNIEFPTKAGEMGTAVVFVNIPKHNIPIVVASLKKEKDVYKLNQSRKRKTKTYKNNSIDVDMDASESRYSISVEGDDEESGKILISIKGNNSSNILKFDIDGDFIQKIKNRSISFADKHEIISINKKGVVVSKIKLSNDDDSRIEIQDEFNNNVSIGKNGITIKDSNGNLIILDDSGIHIDSNKNDIKLTSSDSIINLSDDGINIDGGGKEVSINGEFEALYNRIPGAPIANISQIGVSKTVKIGL